MTISAKFVVVRQRKEVMHISLWFTNLKNISDTLRQKRKQKVRKRNLKNNLHFLILMLKRCTISAFR